MRFPWPSLVGSLCALCRQRVYGAAAERQLCHYCLAELPWHPADARENSYPGIRRLVVPLSYEGYARNWVLRTKQGTGLVEARVLGTLLAEAVAGVYPHPRSRPDRILPVPLSYRRLARRGHNQAALIATPVARVLGLPLDRFSVRRQRHGAFLADLPVTQRQAAISGAFRATRRLDGLTVAIIDDVVTTGATAIELARTLTAAGVDEVHLWCATGSPTGSTSAPT